MSRLSVGRMASNILKSFPNRGMSSSRQDGAWVDQHKKIYLFIYSRGVKYTARLSIHPAHGEKTKYEHFQNIKDTIEVPIVNRFFF